MNKIQKEHGTHPEKPPTKVSPSEKEVVDADFRVL
jgi:hypothetical protein